MASNRNAARAHYHRIFEKHLQSLNSAQAEAVSSIDGPMMVIAGPGTGKTHILTARIGRILRDTDTPPGSILCLTFTDAGVYAMRERLLELIGPEAHRVHIYTFHSFCNTVIQENMEYFGRHELEPLSDLERVELIRLLIDQLPANHLLRQKSNDIYYYERHLDTLFKQMKMENWSPDYVVKMADAYLADLPNREAFVYKRNTKEFKKGDLKTWKIEEEKQRMAYLKAGAALFPTYRKLMERARRYDFDDMILWVLDAFEKNEALLRNYQERYLYFLVDEYQDTNGSQNQILQRLIQYWDNPNVFIVGDDDQSIFEFQGARLKNLTEFYQDYQAELSLVMLTDNYRSSQNILDSSRNVIEQNKNRIIHNFENIEKILAAQHQEFAASTILPEVVAYDNRAQEDADIVQQIEQLQAEDFPLDEVAIIYAKHRQARNIITLLEKKQIPYNTRKQINILDLPIIQNLRLLLEYLNAEYQRPFSGETMLYQVLSFDFLKIDPTDLATLSLYMAKLPEGQRWRTVIGNEKILADLKLKVPEKILQFSSLLNELIGEYRSFTLLRLIEKIINRSGLLASILQKEDKAWQLQIINTFFSFVQKENDRHPRLNLKKLLATFDNMDANRLPIRIQKTIHAKNGVNLATAHSSKGLEFRHVFIIDAVKDMWEAGKRAGSRRFSLPDTLTFSDESDVVEARRRLFYVAMTRAKESLHISYAKQNNAGKSMQRAMYIDEIMADGKLKRIDKTPPDNVMLDAQLLLMLTQAKPKIPAANEAAVAALLEGFALSVTSLNSFLRCPLSFYYEQVLKIPSVQSEAASYGIAMHYALSKLFEIRELDPAHRLPTAEEAVSYFVAEMKRLSGYFTRSEYKRRVEMGTTHLQLYYQQHQSKWPEKILVELPVKNTEIDGVPVKGVIDRIDFAPKSSIVEIVDYKTGQPRQSRFAKFTEANPNGGLYRRQLIFYKLLYESAQKEFTAKKGTIAYFEPDFHHEFTTKSLTFTANDVGIVRSLIKDSYAKIQAQAFYEGCGEPTCKWCNFVKNNIMVDSFADEEAEALDD